MTSLGLIWKGIFVKGSVWSISKDDRKVFSPGTSLPLNFLISFFCSSALTLSLSFCSLPVQQVSYLPWNTEAHSVLAWILSVVVRTPKVCERWTFDLIFPPLIKWTYMTWPAPARRKRMVHHHQTGACWALQIFEMSIHLIMSPRLKDQAPKKKIPPEEQKKMAFHALFSCDFQIPVLPLPSLSSFRRGPWSKWRKD